MPRCHMILTLMLLVGLGVMLANADQEPVEKNPVIEALELATLDQRLSYTLGLNFGQSIKTLPAQFDVKLLERGIRDAMENSEPLLSPQQLQKTMQEFQMQMTAHYKQREEIGETFRKDNGGREEVTVTATGLQYEVLKAGDGPSPKATDRVMVHYRGTLIDGTEFDSSFKRGAPVTFALNQVISGWTEGVQLMKVGAKYKFVVPSKLAYGQRGSPPKIGPNETLIFDIELIKINP